MAKRLLYGFAVDADDFPYPEFGQTDILITVRLCNGNFQHTAFNAATVQLGSCHLKPTLPAVVRRIDGEKIGPVVEHWLVIVGR